MARRRLPLALLCTLLPALLAGCEAQPLPSAQAVRDLGTHPPELTQMIYASGALPDDRPALQRVRMLAWLRELDLDAGQLQRLSTLRALAAEQRARVAKAEAELSAKVGPEEDAIYARIWDRLAAGAAPDDPALTQVTGDLRRLRARDDRSAVLTLRLESIRVVMEAARPFLDTLSEKQEAALSDSLFLLRHRLDPVGTPGDYEALVGSTYDAGEAGILLRGTSAGADAPLDLGGLWSDAAPDTPARRDALPEARREALLYLALLEPGLDEAIQGSDLNH